MTKLAELYFREILDDKISIEEVPSKLRDKVQEELDKINQIQESGE